MTLIATETKPDCIQWTISLLNFLRLNGYQVSQQKTQMVWQQVTYLGCKLSGTEQNEAICRTPLRQTVKGLRTFLGLTGWCRVWIYNYGITVRPLCELLKNNPTRLIWSKEAQNAFKTLKKELMKAPALGLPDVTKPFWLFSLLNSSME